MWVRCNAVDGVSEKRSLDIMVYNGTVVKISSVYVGTSSSSVGGVYVKCVVKDGVSEGMSW